MYKPKAIIILPSKLIKIVFQILKIKLLDDLLDEVIR